MEGLIISAGCIDEVNVQIIMERFGGGGHMNASGAQFDHTDVDAAVAELKRVLDEMIEGGDISMKVILKEDIKSLGKKGEIVEVSDGYARNFILKKNKGVEANSSNLNDLKLKKANDDKIAQEQYEAAKELGKQIEAGQIQVSIKMGEGGKAFGSVSSKEIAEEVKSSWI